MSDEQYVPTETDRKVSLLHIVTGHFRSDATKTIEDIIAGADKLHAWIGKAAATRTRTAKTTAATPAEGVKDTAPAKTEEKPAPVADVEDLDTGSEDDDFLNEGAAEEKPAPKAKPATMEDVRAALLALQTRTDAITARAVLSKASGVSTLGKMKLESFQAVIDAANKQTVKIADPTK